MNIDQILATAVKAIKSAMPEAIYQGSLVTTTRAFDPLTSVNSIVSTIATPVEIVFDSFTSEELSGSTIKSTDVKLIVIADKVKVIDFYMTIMIASDEYRITRKLESVVGSKAAVFTIVAEKL